MNDSGGNMSEKGIIDALGRCSRCGQHVQSTAGCDCHTRPNDANERLESLVDAEIQEIGKLRVERDALQASIDDAPTWTIKNGKLDNWNSLTSLDFHNKTVTVALVQKSEHTAEPLGECTECHKPVVCECEVKK
jgi:hypothetical protein